MLHSYAFTNFLSFHERTEVSLKMTKAASALGWDTLSPSGQRLATAQAVIGANASGKTSLLKPLAFAAWFASNSFHQLAPNADIPVKPHFAHSDEPVEVEVEVEDAEGMLWRYSLGVSPQRVLWEELYKKAGSYFSYVFKREWDDASRAYRIKQRAFGFRPSEAAKVRENASLISTAAQYGVDLASRLAQLHVSSNISAGGLFEGPLTMSWATNAYLGDSEMRAQMIDLLKKFDFGLAGLEIEESELPAPRLSSGLDLQPKVKQITTSALHVLNDGRQFVLPFHEESNGTKTAFITLWYLLTALKHGGLAVIDELESHLHPHILNALLELFASKKSNPHRAQLIFTSHSLEVLNVLGKSQVTLVEKKDCASSAWRLDSMVGVRSQDNLYAKYMGGAYGAVPDL